LGFFEVVVWLLAIGQIMQNLNNWVCYIAYGLGFAMGNLIGISLEEKTGLRKADRPHHRRYGRRQAHQKPPVEGFGVTSMDARGSMAR